MSSKIIEKVEQLNKKITQISNKRVEAEAESKMLLRNLKQGISEYEKKYGVSLKGKNFDEIAKLVMEEYNTVKTAVEEEYELSSKVVSLIEKGDVKEAKAILEKARAENWEEDEEGNATEEKEPEVEKPVEKVVEKPVEKVVEKEVEKTVEHIEDDEDEFEETGFDEDDNSVEEDETSDDDEVDFGSEMSMEDDDFEEPTADEPVKVPTKEVKEVKSAPVEDDDDDMDFGFNFDDEDEEPVKVKKEEPVKEEPKAAEPVKEKKDDVVSLDNAFSFDDDDDDDNGDFMGFGKILSGSKFEV